MWQCSLRAWSLSIGILAWLCIAKSASAEILPDATLPSNSTVTRQGNVSVIEGGTRRGNNLFHSFREFSFSNTAFFNNDLAVRNIIARVTGETTSRINGTLRANGTANLFLINPRGVIFGSRASLQIGGSFVASTATSLRFADGTEFSAVNSQISPLLTVSVPSGLQFGQTPGEIVNKSRSNLGQDESETPTGGLQVNAGSTLALVGGNIRSIGGILTTEGGRIELGAVGAHEASTTQQVSLTPVGSNWTLGYGEVRNFQDIQFSKGTTLNAGGVGGGSFFQ